MHEIIFVAVIECNAERVFGKIPRPQRRHNLIERAHGVIFRDVFHLPCESFYWNSRKKWIGIVVDSVINKNLRRTILPPHYKWKYWSTIVIAVKLHNIGKLPKNH